MSIYCQKIFLEVLIYLERQNIMKILPLKFNNTCLKAKQQKFDCNQTDSKGVPFFEKVIKAENRDFLRYFYLTDEDIKFTPGMLEAYNNIKNPDFKKEIDYYRIFMRFPELEQAIRDNNTEEIEKGIKTISECKFCNHYHALNKLVHDILIETDSINDKYTRSIVFVKSIKEYMPKALVDLFLRYTKYIDNIMYFIKHPEKLEMLYNKLPK